VVTVNKTIHSGDRLWDHTHEQHFACSPPVSRIIIFPPTRWLLLPWQGSPPEKIRSDAAHPVISTPQRLHTSEIPLPKSVSSAVTHRCHHRPALPFQDWHPFTKPVLILAEENSSTFCSSCLRRFVHDLEVWYVNLKVSPPSAIQLLNAGRIKLKWLAPTCLHHNLTGRGGSTYNTKPRESVLRPVPKYIKHPAGPGQGWSFFLSFLGGGYPP